MKTCPKTRTGADNYETRMGPGREGIFEWPGREAYSTGPVKNGPSGRSTSHAMSTGRRSGVVEGSFGSKVVCFLYILMHACTGIRPLPGLGLRGHRCLEACPGCAVRGCPEVGCIDALNLNGEGRQGYRVARGADDHH